VRTVRSWSGRASSSWRGVRSQRICRVVSQHWRLQLASIGAYSFGVKCTPSKPSKSASCVHTCAP
jgi:hypothetical protein